MSLAIRLLKKLGSVYKKDMHLSQLSESINSRLSFTAQKYADSVDKYLLRLKGIEDQLIAAKEKITKNDLVIPALSRLPLEFEMIKIVILAIETPISMKDFRAQLLGAEGSI